MSGEILVRGVGALEATLKKKAAQIEANESRAEKAAANVLKVMMRREAPYETTAQRDIARRKAKVRHLRATIRVRRTRSGHWAVGPASPLAHLIIRGAARGAVETAGGAGGEAHQMTLAGRRQFRQHARGVVGPVGAAQALAITAGGQTFFRASARPGPMPKNDFISRTRELAAAPAKQAAGDVLFRNAPDVNEGA